MKGRRRPNNDLPHSKRKRVNQPERNIPDEKEDNFEDDYVEIDQKPSAYELLLASLGANAIPEEEEDLKDEPKIPILKQYTEANEQEEEDEEEEIELKSKKNKTKSVKKEEESDEEKGEEEEEYEEEQLGESEINTIKAELEKEKAQNADDFFAIQTLTKLTKEQIEKISENKKLNYKKDKLEKINQFFKKYEIGDIQYADVTDENQEFDKSIKKFESIKEISDLELSSTKKMKKEYSEFLGNYFLKNKLKINFENEINKATKDYFKLRKQLTSIYSDFIPLPNSMNLFKHFCGFFPLFNEYFDVLHSACDELHTFPLRQAYLLHSLNHCLKFVAFYFYFLLFSSIISIPLTILFLSLVALFLFFFSLFTTKLFAFLKWSNGAEKFFPSIMDWFIPFLCGDTLLLNLFQENQFNKILY